MSAQLNLASLIGFLIVTKTAKEDGFTAALMVTDERGYPLEFRATTPVRPTLVQRTLYGNSLQRYVGVELCGKTLVQQSARKPRAILVPERWLLDIANQTGSSLVAVWRAGEALKVEEGSAVRGAIKPVGATFQPLVYEARLKDAHDAELIAFMEGCHSRFDLIEVFDRMRAALQLLAKEDPRYS